jgi:ABC-2 type transport system permease protein
MNPILTLLKPKLLAFKNQLTRSSTTSHRGQALAIGGVSLIIMAGLFFGTTWGLTQLINIPLLVYVPPSIPLGLMLMMLMIMTSLTALASALGTFYLADDVETILASPTSSFSFFAARLAYVLCTVAWMPFVFIFPVLAAMGFTYNLNAWFIPGAIATFLPYFLIPASIGSLLATLFMSTISQKWAKLVVRLTIMSALVGLLFVTHGLVEAITTKSSDGQILRLVSSISIAQSEWMPSAWASTILSELLVPSGKNIATRLVLLYSCAISLAGIAHIALHLLHARGFSRALARRAAARNDAGSNLTRDYQSLPAPIALIQKDFRMLTRDIAQSTQIIFLVGLCLLYMGNLKTFVAIDAFASNSSINWQRAFFIIHTAITAFFTSAVCTRLVFASLSLEGKSYWILQTAPIAFRDILRAKFIGWFIPVSVVSSVLFAVGTQVLIGRWEITLLFGILSFLVSYGIVGMGIGLGAYFADFSWEHPSQLALSLGSFVYMLSSALLVLLNMFPMGFLLQLLLVKSPSTLHIAAICLVAGMIAAMNIGAAKFALRLGERSPAALE